MTQDEFKGRVEDGQRKGWVYFVESGPTSAIKVGWAKDPAKRMRLLQIGHQEELQLIGVLPGTRHLEADLHRRLRRHRVLGEWFERRAVLRLVRPVIKSHGIFVIADVSDPRNIPAMRKTGRIPYRQFIAQIDEVS